jgi:hypothetical protein
MQFLTIVPLVGLLPPTLCRGPAWGEDGYFRIVRGVDECAIESIPASGVPVISSPAQAAAQLR